MIRYETRPARIQATAVAEPFHRYVFEDGTVWTEFYRSGKGYLLRFPAQMDGRMHRVDVEVEGHMASAKVPFPEIRAPIWVPPLGAACCLALIAAQAFV